MEKSLCVLAAVIILGTLLDESGSLIINATTESYSLSNYTTTVTVNWTEPVTVEDRRRNLPTTTTAQKLFTTAFTGKQLDTKNISKVNKNKDKEETDDSKKEDKKAELGKKNVHLKHPNLCQVGQFDFLYAAVRSQRGSG